MRQAPNFLASPPARCGVRDAMVNVCRFRSWFLYALHVRTNHVQGIVDAAESSPSRVFNAWKGYASRSLRAAGEGPSDRIYWTHGGSARRILTPQDLARAMHYVLQSQGQPLETFYADPRFVTPP